MKIPVRVCAFSENPLLSYDTIVDIELTKEQEEAYLRAKRLRIPLDEVEELWGVLNEADDETIDYLPSENSTEFLYRCMGKYPVDVDVVKELVRERDEKTLSFFGLDTLAEEEIDKWNPNRVEMPNVCDFYDDFVETDPYNPDIRYETYFEESINEDELSEVEAAIMITDLANTGREDHSDLYAYIDNCDEYYKKGSLAEFAIYVMNTLGRNDMVMDLENRYKK